MGCANYADSWRPGPGAAAPAAKRTWAARHVLDPQATTENHGYRRGARQICDPPICRIFVVFTGGEAQVIPARRTFAREGQRGRCAQQFARRPVGVRIDDALQHLQLAAGQYWIGVITGASNSVAGYRYDSVEGARDWNANTYTSGPTNPFGSFTTDNEQMSLYATYTAGRR